MDDLSDDACIYDEGMQDLELRGVLGELRWGTMYAMVLPPQDVWRVVFVWDS